ncbi:hypothetical protein WKW79_36415 [Variovorax robiniae]|uniref:Helix-turn-helix domain-containing protein n=1 Tax=Variovorax robiniae TaxID=1836199 RepID=A0ABU8XK24_9BURK
MTSAKPKATASRRPGRPAHQRDEAIARRVAMLIGCGVRVADVAALLSLSEPTLRRAYGDEVRLGHVRAGAMVAQSLFKAATHPKRPDTKAAVFWLRSRCGWTEVAAPAQPPEPGKKDAAQALGLVAERGTSWDGLLNPDSVQ